ncbi:MAG: ChrB protein [Planctomycetes bacterium]|nr:ChrB protein [Planctomycetota bacterium]
MNWLLLVYRIPREPTAGRVYVWRKLKQLGATSLQDAVWVLPVSDRNREHFQWVASEIIELGGEVSVFDSELLMTSAEPTLRERFEGPVRDAYQEILETLKRGKPDLAALSKKYQQTKAHDFFQCPLGDRVRDKLVAAQGGNR